MSTTDDHRWNVSKSDAGCQSESEEVFETKYKEWQRRDWIEWLGSQLTFPFQVVRKEDCDDAYFDPGATKDRFRLGHRMEVVGLDENDVDQGVMIKVREKGKTGCVPLGDVEVEPKSDTNYWPVREYVVWSANR